MIDKKSPSALVLPFGKHKGLTVAEVLAKDPGYAEWLTAQGWLADRFAELHAAIATRGKEADDSPEHNAMQVKFLEPVWAVSTMLAAYPGEIAEAQASLKNAGRWAVEEKASRAKSNVDYLIREVAQATKYTHEPDLGFHPASYYQDEAARLTDRLVEARPALAEAEAALAAFDARPIPKLKCTVRFEVRGVDVSIHGQGFEAAVELKPSMGDDFPSVMRQMQRNGARILVVRSFSGTSVAEPLVRQMFEANGKRLVMERDIEAEIANARGITDADPPKR